MNDLINMPSATVITYQTTTFTLSISQDSIPLLIWLLLVPLHPHLYSILTYPLSFASPPHSLALFLLLFFPYSNHSRAGAYTLTRRLLKSLASSLPPHLTPPSSACVDGNYLNLTRTLLPPVSALAQTHFMHTHQIHSFISIHVLSLWGQEPLSISLTLTSFLPLSSIPSIKSFSRLIFLDPEVKEFNVRFSTALPLLIHSPFPPPQLTRRRHTHSPDASTYNSITKTLNTASSTRMHLIA
jgi:hypothetical protein